MEPEIKPNITEDSFKNNETKETKEVNAPATKQKSMMAFLSEHKLLIIAIVVALILIVALIYYFYSQGASTEQAYSDPPPIPQNYYQRNAEPYQNEQEQCPVSSAPAQEQKGKQRQQEQPEEKKYTESELNEIKQSLIDRDSKFEDITSEIDEEEDNESIHEGEPEEEVVSEDEE